MLRNQTVVLVKKVGRREGFRGTVVGRANGGYVVEDDAGKKWLRSIKELDVLELAQGPMLKPQERAEQVEWFRAGLPSTLYAEQTSQ